MADFLKNLVARTQGVTPVAQPLIAPLYAPELPAPALPDSPAVPPALHPEPADTRPDRPIHHDGQSSAQNRQPLPNQPAVEAAQFVTPSVPLMDSSQAQAEWLVAPDALTDGLHGQENASQHTLQTRATQHQRQTLTASESAGEKAQPQTAATFPSPDEPFAAHQSEPIVSPRSDLTRTSIRSPNEPMAANELRPNQQPSRAAEQRVESDSLLVATPGNTSTTVQPEHIVDAPAQIDLIGPAATEVQPRLGKPQRRPIQTGEIAKQREAAASPVIQVTIGRVEVRAVQPAPTPAPRPPASGAPKVSLEDYLRSQTGGRR